MPDPFGDFKAKQRDVWKHFAPLETVTTMSAARLVRFANVKGRQRVLDVGCGTGVAAIAARRAGATAVGLDLTPELLVKARENGSIAGFEDIEWREGDVEDLPFLDATFDVVLSHLGHMAAPRPELAAKEMVRVLRPKGTLALASWPADGLVVNLFLLGSKYVYFPTGVPPPTLWGDPSVVKERLGVAMNDFHFERSMVHFPAMSPQHYRRMNEMFGGGLIRIVEALKNEPAKLAAFRREYDAIASDYLKDGAVQMECLFTRAVKQ